MLGTLTRHHVYTTASLTALTSMSFSIDRFASATVLLALTWLGGCGSSGARGADLTSVDSTAIADSIRAMARSAYDLAEGKAVEHMMSVYPPSGRIVSATAGRVTSTRDSLQQAVDAFWQGVGRFMVRPRWEWGSMTVDVLDRNVVVMTAQYTVPHWTPEGAPHVLGGVWTSVWSRQDGRFRVIHEHLSDLPRALAEQMEAAMSPADSAHAGAEHSH